MKSSVVGAVAVAVAMVTASANAGCELHQIAELPLTMRGGEPVVQAQINGKAADVIFDTGGATTILEPTAQAKFGLTPDAGHAPVHLISQGQPVGLAFTRVSQFSFAGRASTQLELPMLAGESNNNGVDGFVGEDIFGDADIEVDLAGGVIRLFAPQGCAGAELAYWAKGADVSAIDIEPQTPRSPRVFGMVRVNGYFVRALFDTGAATSALTRIAAARAGVEPSTPGVTAAPATIGIGNGGPLSTWIARFDSFGVGDEIARGVTLPFIDKPGASAEMIVGADFFLSHRVMMARSQGKLYFTYNGHPLYGSVATHGGQGAAGRAESSDAAAPPPPPPLREGGATPQAGMNFSATPLLQ